MDKIDVKELILDSTKDFNYKTGIIEHEYKVLKEKQSNVDLLRNDVLHSIELDKLDGIAMVKACKQLRGILRLRRSYKEDIEICTRFRARFNTKATAQALQEIIKTVQNQDERQYTERIKDDVKKEIEKEIAQLE